MTYAENKTLKIHGQQSNFPKSIQNPIKLPFVILRRLPVNVP